MQVGCGDDEHDERCWAVSHNTGFHRCNCRAFPGISRTVKVLLKERLYPVVDVVRDIQLRHLVHSWILNLRLKLCKPYNLFNHFDVVLIIVCLHSESKNPNTILLSVTSPNVNTDFRNSFTVRLTRKFVTKSSHPKRVAVLPCEISMFKKLQFLRS